MSSLHDSCPRKLTRLRDADLAISISVWLFTAADVRVHFLVSRMAAASRGKHAPRRVCRGAARWRDQHVVHIEVVPLLGHDCGMSRVRVSTTVDENLLAEARRALEGQPDAVVIDEALRSLLLRHRSVELDAEYAAYDAHPLEEPDEWGDLASFRDAAAAT